MFQWHCQDVKDDLTLEILIRDLKLLPTKLIMYTVSITGGKMMCCINIYCSFSEEDSTTTAPLRTGLVVGVPLQFTAFWALFELSTSLTLYITHLWESLHSSLLKVVLCFIRYNYYNHNPTLKKYLQQSTFLTMTTILIF